MDSATLIRQLRTAIQFFDTSTAWLTEDDAAFVPADGLFSAAQQIAHVAQTIDWFVEGAFGTGWNLDFAEHEAEVRRVVRLEEARAELQRAVERAVEVLDSKSPEELADPPA